MIVKNEAAILARCIRSAKPFINRWCIVDTGSTDETMKVVYSELADLRGTLFERPWVNFGHNRTEALKLAQSVMNIDEVRQSWALLLDADHELIDHGFKQTDLTADAYTLIQRDGALEYPNPRLLWMLKDWVCTGPTHEYWPHDESTTPLCKTLSILDHNDGGCRADKLTRDKKLLLDDLRAHPNSERSVFYLGQTLDAMGDESAIDLYRLRATMGGFNEEAWMARYRAARSTLDRELKRILFGRSIGRELLRLEDCQGPAEMLRAVAENLRRAEALWHLAHFYRLADKPTLGYLFAQRAKAIGKPEKGLFVEHQVYDVLIDEELAICSYYAGDLLRGGAACERLENIGNIQGRNNSFWYAALLDGERSKYEVPEDYRTFDGVVYNCSNPSLCGDLVNVRLVGYKQIGGKVYTSMCDDGVIRTRNAIGRDGEWSILDDRLPDDWNHGARIRGLEDIRLTRYQGRIWFTSTCCEVPGADGNPRVVLGRLSEDCLGVDHIVPIPYGNPVEKNWLPWADGERLRVVYSFCPLIMLDLDPETGNVLRETPPFLWSAPGRLRGSAGPIKLPSGHWLAVAHDVAYLDTHNIYTHRLVAWKGEEFFATNPLLLEHRGIEYCCGMALEGDTLTLSYGFEDREAHWVKTSLAHVLVLLGITDGQGLPIDRSLASHSA
jgi:glycosyltransferase involved in cell wall biosynthesis